MDKKQYTDEEQKIKNAILDYIRFFPRKGFAWSQYNGARYDPRRKIFLKHTKYHRKGVPDILGVWCTLALFIEVKRPGGVLSKEQREFIDQAKDHGAIAFVAYSLQGAMKILNWYDLPSASTPRPQLLKLDNENEG